MITTPEIICDVFFFLDKDQIERIQLVNKLWNNGIIRHKNILPLRKFEYLNFMYDRIHLISVDFMRPKKTRDQRRCYRFDFNRTNLIEENESSYYDIHCRCSKKTVDKVLKNLNDVVFEAVEFFDCNSEYIWDSLLNVIKLATKKTGNRIRGRFGHCDAERFGSKLNEIVDNYIIVDELTLGISNYDDSYIREVCVNPEIIQLPSTPKEIRLKRLQFKENDEVLNFTCNGKLNGANRLTIEFETSNTNYGNFIRQWFELYRTHENPISLVGKFEVYTRYNHSVIDAVKSFLNNTQLRVKYSLETKECHIFIFATTYQYLNRRCVLHETDSYALVIEMAYDVETDMSSINASDLDQPPCNKMKWISFCVKSL